MPETETVIETVQTDTGGVVRQGANKMALLAPLADGANANVVTEYRRAQDVADVFTAGSDMALGASAALGSGMPAIYTVGAAPLTGSPFTDSFAAVDTGGLTVGNMPLTEVTDVQVDGSALAGNILYTSQDPTTLTPNTGDIYINPSTGVFQLGTAASTSVDITYSAHDWDAAFDALDLNSYEVHTIANHPLSAQNYGIYEKLLTHAASEDKFVAVATESGVTASSISDLLTAVQDDRLFIAGAFYTGDGTSAVAAALTRTVVNGTMKEQPAPSGVTFTDTYTRSEFGGEETPANGTWHQMGANVIFQDEGGTYRFSNSRAAQGLTDFYRFIDTHRSVRYVRNRVQEDLLALRRRSPVAIPFNGSGLELLRTTIAQALGACYRQGIIEKVSPGAIVIPPLSSIPDTDRQNRVVSGVEVPIQLQGQVHLIKLTLNVQL